MSGPGITGNAAVGRERPEGHVGQRTRAHWRSPRRAVAAAVSIGMFASLALTFLFPVEAASDDTPRGLRVVGELPAVVFTAENVGASGGGNAGRFDVPTPMVVDREHNLGFAAGVKADGTLGLAMYDLVDLTLLKLIDFSFNALDPPPTDAWAVDEERERLVMPDIVPVHEGATCDQSTLRVVEYAEQTPGDRKSRGLQVRTVPFPCPQGLDGLTVGIAATGASVYAPTDKLYFSAEQYHDALPRNGADEVPTHPLAAYDNYGAGLLVVQVDISGAEPTLDWMVDLQAGGCGRRQSPFVERHGNDVISYCYDTQVSTLPASGQQGYVARIPLDDELPVPVGDSLVTNDATGVITNPTIRRTPSLPGPVTAAVDPQSGRLLLATADSPANGNAVWVFNPAASRFVGVVSGGFGDQPTRNAGFGFDPERGRGYLLTANGILVAPVRASPLPAGTVYPVLANPGRMPHFLAHSRNGAVDEFTDATPSPIAVASNLPRPRLFVPVRRGGCALIENANGRPESRTQHCPRYVVVEDETLDPEPIETDDPDRLTADIEEEEGKTSSDATGSAEAAGARVLVTGGVPRTVHQNDLFCTWPFPTDFQLFKDAIQFERQLYGGACVAGQVINVGNRDFSIAAAALDVGSSTGATADAGGVVVASTDNATDGDIKRAGTCGQDNLMGAAPSPPPESTTTTSSTSTTSSSSTSTTTTTTTTTTTPPSTTSTTAPPDPWADGCNDFQDGLADTPLPVPDPRGGTRGTDEKGFPVPAAHCGDFGGAATTDSQKQDVTDPRTALSSSSVSCDADKNTATGTSTSGGMMAFAGSTPMVSVAKLFSSVHSVRTAEGQTTTVVASARGIIIGPVTIGEVRSEAVTKAHGRPNTTSATITRLWCDIQGAGVKVTGCIDPTTKESQAQLDTLNDKLGRLRIEVTPSYTEATKRGYQAIALKDPGAAAADGAVNDDDSPAVPGMQVVYYNDGSEGRNRYIVQLANVRSEARYGITEAPDFGFEEEEPPAEVIDEVGPDVPDVPEAEDVAIAEFSSQDDSGDEYFDIVGAVPVSETRPFFSLPARGRPFPERLLRVPAEIVKTAMNLLVNKPGQFALLFALWTLLATPVYLGLRRRSFAQALLQ